MSEQFDIAVIGAGPGGYIAALKAAQLGAQVAVIEKHHLGGTCLNYGCIPSKALLASAELIHSIQHAGDLGVSVSGSVEFDWTKIQQRKDKVLKKLRGGVKGLFGARGVKLYQGSAQLAGPGKIQISTDKGATETITAKNTIIAAGSVPMRIPGWPDDPQVVCTSDEALHWQDLPKRLLIVGGGVIGCEFACMMHGFGVEVTVVEMMETLLPGMETELGLALEQSLSKRGIKIYTGTKVDEISQSAQGIKARITGMPDPDVDRVLVATGRRANTESLGLDSVGISTDRGFIRVNQRMQTAVPGYYCIGDANGQCLLAHAASAQGIAAVQDALGRGSDFDLPIPSAVYTFPEVAAVGLTSEQANEQGIPISVGQFPIGHLGKAMAVGEEFGFARIVRRRTDNSLLGVHLIGHNATEIIEAATAMLGLKANAHDLADMVFAHPTIGEAVKEAAEDSFQQALHLPPRKVTRMMAEIV